MVSRGKDMRTVVEVASCPALNPQQAAPQYNMPQEPIYAVPIKKTSAINIGSQSSSHSSVTVNGSSTIPSQFNAKSNISEKQIYAVPISKTSAINLGSQSSLYSSVTANGSSYSPPEVRSNRIAHDEPIYAIPISKTSPINIHMLFDQAHKGPVVGQTTGQKISDSLVTANGPSSTQVPNKPSQVIANGVASVRTSKPAYNRSLSDEVTVTSPPANTKPLTKTASLDTPPIQPSTLPPPPPPPPSPPPLLDMIKSQKLQVTPTTSPKEETSKPKTDIISELKARQELLKAYHSKPESAKPESKISPPVSPPVSPEPPKDSIRSESEADSESATWTSLEDSHSEMSSSSSSAGFENDSACSVTGSEDREDAINRDRVVLVADSNMAVFLQLTCDNEIVKNNKFVTMVTEIANACASYFNKKESSKLNTTQVGQLIMPDRRHVTDHVTEAEKEFSDSITITKARCLRAKGNYLAVQVNEKMDERGRCILGRSAVAVVLKKMNKFAAAEAFSEQLCLHILTARPTGMGSRANLNIQLEKERKSRREKASSPDTHLLGQTFIPDPTITVWEAAKRSFVDIEEFILV